MHFDLEALQCVIGSVLDDWVSACGCAQEGGSNQIPSAVAVCHVANLALATMIRAADYAATEQVWDPDKGRRAEAVLTTTIAAGIASVVPWVIRAGRVSARHGRRTVAEAPPPACRVGFGADQGHALRRPVALSPSHLNAPARKFIAHAMRDTAHGDRVATALQLAEQFHVSRTAIYRAAELGGPARRRKPDRPEYREWTRVIVDWQYKDNPPKPIRPQHARRAAIEAGALPSEAAELPIATFYKVRRELDLVPRAKRAHRLSADYPMQAALIDASGSEHLVVDGPNAGDETRLKLHRNPLPASGYKNKPISRDRLRCWVYALWDMCTGLFRARYCVARGETAHDAMAFLCWALAPSADRRVVLHGVPEDLWSDLGPLTRSQSALDLLDRLDINPVTGKAYQKARMGGVEKTHSTRWAFERVLFYLDPKAPLTLAGVNARLQEFEIEENSRFARTRVDGRQVSRTAAWVALVNRRPKDRPLRRLPEDPMETMACEARRKIDVNGIVRWGGVEYESEAWHDRWVIARRGVKDSGDTITIEDEITGERQEARRYAPRPYGDIRSAPATPHERLLAEGAAVEHEGVDLFKPKSASAVVPLPARTSEAAPLENPLDADHCRDIGEAMRVFAEHYIGRPLRGSKRARVKALIEKSGLSRRNVIEIAGALLKGRSKSA